MNDCFYVYESHIEIGLTIKKLRIQAGLSQTKLAEGICDRTTIIHLEKGRAKQPSIYLLNQLCRRLSITLDDFFLLAYGGEINQFWLKRNEIDALTKIRDYNGALKLAKKYYKPVIAFAGCVTSDAAKCNEYGIDAFFPILRNITTLEVALDTNTAYNNLRSTAYQVFRLLNLTSCIDE